MTAKHKEREKAAAYQAKLDAAMADFTPPTLEELLKEGDRLFKRKPARRLAAAKRARERSAKRSRPTKTAERRPTTQSRATGRRNVKCRVGILRQDDPEGGHSSNRTLASLLSEIRRLRPRHDTDPEWSFVLGGKRNYVFLNTQGPGAFTGGYPVWRGRTFEGCKMFALQWKDLRKILERVYAGVSLADCFARYEGSFEPYASG